MTLVLGLLVLAAIVVGVMALVRRLMDRRGSGADQGGDIIVYLLLALAVGVTGFALVSLAATAFPSTDFVLDAKGRVANALAALVVATPVAVFLWRRQESRRAVYPTSPGWTVYLTLIEAVFTTALVMAIFDVVDTIIGDGEAAAWSSVVVFGAVFVFHEWATHRKPPGSDSAELPRVVGSAIGLIPAVLGLGGIIGWLLSEVYATFTPTAGGSDLATWVSLLVAGAPIWAYRWLRSWPGEPSAPRQAFGFLVSVAGLSTAIGSGSTVLTLVVEFLFTDTAPAGTHFDILPPLLSAVVVGGAVWAHHRHRLGAERSDSVRSYEYAMAALGLLGTVGAATALAGAAFGPDDLIGNDAEIVIPLVVGLATAASVWLFYWSRADRQPRETEASSPPRRFYIVAMAVITGLASAGALIGTLVVLFQRLLGSGEGDTLSLQASLFVFAGLVTWHLLHVNSGDRELIVSEVSLTPFDVTIICSHPGIIATRFPSVAKLHVIYRNDDSGHIDEEMADEIVAAVGNRPSLVWVDSDGYRVAPAR